MAPAGRASSSEGQHADRLRLAGAASGIINRYAGFGGRPPETAPAMEPGQTRQRLDRASASLRTGQMRKRLPGRRAFAWAVPVRPDAIPFRHLAG